MNTWDDAAADAVGRIASHEIADFLWHRHTGMGEGTDLYMAELRRSFTDGESEAGALFLRFGRRAWDAIGGEWLERDMVDLLCRKHHDYGPGNILGFGAPGLFIRMHDKLARLKNLLARGDTPANESLLDTLCDVVGYAAVGLMLIEGTFELPLRADLVA